METKEIITPIGGIKIALKSFITGRESREIKGVYFKGVKFKMENQVSKSDDIDMSKITEDSENKAIETVVISVNGNEENKLDTILDMNVKDYDFVKEEVNKVINGDDFLEKSQTENSGTEQEASQEKC